MDAPSVITGLIDAAWDAELILIAPDFTAVAFLPPSSGDERIAQRFGLAAEEPQLGWLQIWKNSPEED